MANKNLMMVNGKDIEPSNVYVKINLADDDAEVRGFGQPISRAKAKEMAENYFTQSEAAWEIVKKIDTEPGYENLKSLNEFAQLKSFLDPASQTVSGVFGKEAILQILSMRHCEGIRYIIGHDGQKNTVILMGVREDGTETGANGVQRAKSAPVELTSPLRTILGDGDVPVDVEVHKDSLTIAGVRQKIRLNNEQENGLNAALATPPVSDILFGPY